MVHGGGILCQPPLGRGSLQAAGYAMLLLEHGVLWVLPMLWLVLLLSEAGGFTETGCILAVGPGVYHKAEAWKT